MVWIDRTWYNSSDIGPLNLYTWACIHYKLPAQSRGNRPWNIPRLTWYFWLHIKHLRKAPNSRKTRVVNIGLGSHRRMHSARGVIRLTFLVGSRQYFQQNAPPPLPSYKLAFANIPTGLDIVGLIVPKRSRGNLSWLGIEWLVRWVVLRRAL